MSLHVPIHLSQVEQAGKLQDMKRASIDPDTNQILQLMCLWFLTDLKHTFSPDVGIPLLKISSRPKDTGNIIKSNKMLIHLLSRLTGLENIHAVKVNVCMF